MKVKYSFNINYREARAHPRTAYYKKKSPIRITS